MAGGLSAGSVRAPRRPRHLLPGGVTSDGTTRCCGSGPTGEFGDYENGSGSDEHFDLGAPAEKAVPGKPTSERVGALLPRSTSETKMASAYDPQRNAVRRRYHASNRPMRRRNSNDATHRRKGDYWEKNEREFT